MSEPDPIASDVPEDAALSLAGDASLSFEDRLSDAALAAVMGDPYEVGLRIALDDGVAAVLPGVARELGWLDRAVAPPPAAPVVAAGLGVAGVAGASVAGDGAVNTGFGGVAAAPATAMAWGEGSAVAMAAAGLTRVERGAMERAAVPVMPATAPPVVPAVRDGGAAGVTPGFGRMEWAGVDWRRLASVPGVAPMPAPPAVTAPPGMPLGVSSVASPESARAVADMAAAPSEPAAAGAAWPSWSAAPTEDRAMPSVAPVGRGAAWSGDAGDWSGGGRGAVAAAMPEQAVRDDAEYAPGGESAGGEAAGFGGVLEVDGALLGRFIAEQLGREAGRPPSGMTGFDPLVSPAWMSASVG